MSNERQAHTAYHVPVRPYGPIDALNRRAAALGSPGYAAATSYADYNGHHVNVWWNDYKGYYIAEYFWAGRVVLARGDFASCLAAALREYERGALGCSVSVTPRADDADALAVCAAEARLVTGSAQESLEWYTWRHECAVRSARDYANPGALVMVFDWALMQEANDQAAYEAALKAKHGRVYQ